MNQLVTSESIFSKDNFDRALMMAERMAKSDLVPKDYKGKPDNVLIAIQMGNEVGLKPMQSLQSIAVINGRPSLWGDGMLALIQSHPACEYVDEKPIYKGDSVYAYSCKIKRRNYPEREVIFTIDDAKKAGLLGKEGPWTTATARMLQMRARSFCVRDTFADALKGLQMAEEVRDYEPLQTHKVMTVNDIVRKIEREELQETEPLKVIDRSSDLNSCIEVIKNSESEIILKDVFKAAYNEFKNEPELLQKIIEAKDKRKAELELQPIDTFFEEVSQPEVDLTPGQKIKQMLEDKNKGGHNERSN